MNNSNKEPSPPETDSASDNPNAEDAFESRRQAAADKYRGLAAETAPTEPIDVEQDPNNPGTLPAKADDPPTEEPTKEAKPRTDKGQFTLDRKQVNKWIAENPQEVARMFPGTDVEIRNQHISVAKRRQKAEVAAEAREQGLSVLQEKLDAQGAEQTTAIDAAMKAVEPAAALMGALASLNTTDDFAKVEAAFINAGIDVDTFMKKRLRKGVASIKTSAESKRIKDLEAQLAAKNAPPEDKVADTETETASEKTPAYTVKTIEAEVDEDHGVRNIADWQKKVQTLAGDEDDEVAIEDAADKVLAEAKRKMGITDGEEPAPAGRKRRVKKEADDDVFQGEVWDIDGRTEWAQNRARNR